MEGIVLFKALANGRRVLILRLLRKNGELAICEIAARLPLSFRSTSRHLDCLYKAGLLNRRQDGLLVYYSLKIDSNFWDFDLRDYINFLN
ncbi:MAG: metalloregulator ArsR/SmtB family transcription factor [Patescibacteria group bacterium]